MSSSLQIQQLRTDCQTVSPWTQSSLAPPTQRQEVQTGGEAKQITWFTHSQMSFSSHLVCFLVHFVLCLCLCMWQCHRWPSHLTPPPPLAPEAEMGA